MQTDRAGPLRFVTQLCVRYAKRYIPDPFLYAVMLFVGVDANSCLEDCHPFSASRT
jgi:short subunit fatty acids transporter